MPSSLPGGQWDSRLPTGAGKKMFISFGVKRNEPKKTAPVAAFPLRAEGLRSGAFRAGCGIRGDKNMVEERPLGRSLI